MRCWPHAACIERNHGAGLCELEAEAADSAGSRQTLSKLLHGATALTRPRSDAGPKIRAKLEAVVLRNPRAKTLNAGRARVDPELEEDLAAWIIERRPHELAVSTNQVISKALSINPSFRNGSRKAMWKWVYPFLHRHRFSIRRKTRVGQKLSGHLQEVRREFVEAVNERFEPGGTLEGTPPALRVNMDETAVFFEMTSSTTINAVNARTVSIRGSGSNSRRLTACVSCAQDGTKLPLFVVFKAKPGATIEQSLDRLLPSGVFGCCQESGWMDERGTQIWFEKVWKPYAASHVSSLLMLDEFKCHLQASFVRKLKGIGTELEVIPGGYTCVLQPCDVGINKPLKDGIRCQYNDWAVMKMDNLQGDAKVPVPDRTDIIRWLVSAWESISSDTIVKTFASIGYGVNPNTQDVDAEDAVTVQDEGDDKIELSDLVLHVRL